MSELQKSTFDEINLRSEQLKAKIIGSKNSEISGTRVYYVSNNGNDRNDGKSPETAWATVAHVNASALQAGDSVLFRRGDIWRGTTLNSVSGVIYSAYGVGSKPTLCGSPFDGAKNGKWEETDVENIYRFSIRFSSDVGGLVMDGGMYHTRKVCVKVLENGTTVDLRDGVVFSSYRDLKQDLEFYHCFEYGTATDSTGKYGYIYLYSDRGNPGERFSEIEFLDSRHIVSCKADGDAPTVFENLRFVYAGLHGISCGDVADLTVRFCEFGWIGGSITAYHSGQPTRLGNAVESYGGCDGFTVENCWIYQIYDAAVTHQYAGAVKTMKNITYCSNLIEYCTYGVEFWLEKGVMKDVLIADNIIRNTGYGWSVDRYNQFYRVISADGFSLCPNRSIHFVGNVFDRSRQSMIFTGREIGEWVGDYENNIFIISTPQYFGYNHSGGFFAFESTFTALPGMKNNRYYCLSV